MAGGGGFSKIGPERLLAATTPALAVPEACAISFRPAFNGG